MVTNPFPPYPPAERGHLPPPPLHPTILCSWIQETNVLLLSFETHEIRFAGDIFLRLLTVIDVKAPEESPWHFLWLRWGGYHIKVTEMLIVSFGVRQWFRFKLLTIRKDAFNRTRLPFRVGFKKILLIKRKKMPSYYIGSYWSLLTGVRLVSDLATNMPVPFCRPVCGQSDVFRFMISNLIIRLKRPQVSMCFSCWFILSILDFTTLNFVEQRGTKSWSRNVSEWGPK